MSVCYGYTEIFAATRCFSTTDLSLNTDNYFHPPYDGLIDGVKLYHINGTQRCGPDGPAAEYDKWGCSYAGGLFTETIFYLDDNKYPLPTLWYPTGSDTIGYSGVNGGVQWIEDAANNECLPKGCGGYTWFTSTIAQRDDSFLIFEQPQRTVATSMKLVLANMETCCEWSTIDNDGEICANIYLLYSSSPTAHPTLSSVIIF